MNLENDAWIASTGTVIRQLARGIRIRAINLSQQLFEYVRLNFSIRKQQAHGIKIKAIHISQQLFAYVLLNFSSMKQQAH